MQPKRSQLKILHLDTQALVSENADDKEEKDGNYVMADVKLLGIRRNKF